MQCLINNLPFFEIRYTVAPGPGGNYMHALLYSNYLGDSYHLK